MDDHPYFKSNILLLNIFYYWIFQSQHFFGTQRKRVLTTSFFSAFCITLCLPVRYEIKEIIFMQDFLYWIVGIIAEIHEFLLTLNDSFEASLSDKMLHFIFIGIFGIALVLLIHLVFSWLAKNDHTIVVTFLYVLTVVIVIAFGIEIGQGITHTGNMEFADIMYGVVGFIAFFIVFALIRAVILAIAGHHRKHGRGRSR